MSTSDSVVSELSKSNPVLEKLAKARAVLVEHNAVVGEGGAGWIDVDAFESAVKAGGGTSDDRIRGLTYEEITVMLGAATSVRTGPLPVCIPPTVLAKAIARVFRAQANGADDEESDSVGGSSHKAVSAKKASRMTPEELVQHFDPEDHTNPVGERLSKISGGKAFVVYVAGRVVNVEITTKLLLELKQGFPPRSEFHGSRVYCVGELPENMVDENPLYPGRPLRPDGTCDQTNRSWEGVRLIVRQFVRVAVLRGELLVNHETANSAIDLAISEVAMTRLQQRYPKSWAQFNELEAQGDLPKLKIALGAPVQKQEGGPRPGRPF